ncbi:ABC transporter ATP-binding protein/permease [Alsobacter sp. SYSU M60028]|uniref:ABC transporter ATP-binding protein/permease n=1 Tax=Alsobacter ponti TaxID=2962936 RepID=A0ABT1LD54_9HYPH|nr:ABC transporter ATP-binding protein/permease [Alsobacter ponti]MCP8939437.1 ABC transporter ATP-binding protein/permease [Alsobacter ponti]
MKRGQIPESGTTNVLPASTGVEQEPGIARGKDAAELSDAAEASALRIERAVDRHSSLWSDLGILFSKMLGTSEGWPTIRLALTIVLVLIGNMFGQIQLNEWNGTFFDAVAKRNTHAFLTQLQTFAVIVVFLLCLVVAQTWLQERLKIRLRERIARVLFDMWLEPKRAYQLSFVGQAGAQPDQRMQEDCRIFSELTAELGVGALQSLLLLVSFIGVLWTLSSYASFEYEGREVVLHGYMVWVAVGYAAAGSGLTWLIGRPLIRLNTERYRREAELRFAIVRVQESAESVSLYAGERDEHRSLNAFLGAVLTASRRLSGALARLTWITSGYGWLAIIVPILAAAPGYFGDRLSFGEMMMVVGAFNQVQQALRFFVDHFPKFADWRSAVGRVATFAQSGTELSRTMASAARIEVREHANARLAFEGLSIALSDGSIIIDDATAEVGAGERVLIKGASGSGKSTLFRAIAGLWPWGTGTIVTPPRTAMMFLSQRPYLPLGTLRAAVCYPIAPDLLDPKSVEAALDRCGLGKYRDALDREERWDRTLSLGQQQRIAFARVLIHRPSWVFMDEATSALDEESQQDLLALFNRELNGTTVLSIAHRPGLERFHTRVLQIRKTRGGAVLVPLPGEAERTADEKAAEAAEPWLKLADSNNLKTPHLSGAQRRSGFVWPRLNDFFRRLRS